MSGPGFINLFLNPSWVSGSIDSLLTEGMIPPPMKKSRVVVDYSSPNIAKDMHVGHLRSTLLGDCISRVLEYCKHDVIRINHVGDWGTQFGMLLCYLREINSSNRGALSIEDLTSLYKAAKVRFDEDPTFRLHSHEEVVKLQKGEQWERSMWNHLCKVSEEMYQTIYRRLGIDPRLKTQGESFYNPFLPELVKELTSKNLITDQ